MSTTIPAIYSYPWQLSYCYSCIIYSSLLSNCRGNVWPWQEFCNKALSGTVWTTDPNRDQLQDPVGYRPNKWPKQGSSTRPGRIQIFLSKIDLFSLSINKNIKKHQIKMYYLYNFCHSSLITSFFIHLNNNPPNIFLSLASFLLSQLYCIFFFIVKL